MLTQDSGPGAASPTDDSVDVLARMLTVELFERSDDIERVGMVFAAMNRRDRYSRRDGGYYTFADVILSRVPRGKEWGAGCADGDCAYHDALFTAHTEEPEHYAHNLAIARAVLEGGIENPIGDREDFVHPRYGGYRSPSESRYVRDPVWGTYPPVWSVAREHGGLARRAPLDLGSTPTRFVLG